ncbi:YCF48-related protein [Pseudomonas sp.]|uniref:WD40/YVTN/BNR-like repeat-containing protein n=1 Tax=Pseudomonas sp. TaxID=306 RepID=UPI00272F0C91|nr:YCF48-related protein [Pseudomonas sp.]MDP2242511.1 YCF48-related protein [Pseudomonas sp.]
MSFTSTPRNGLTCATASPRLPRCTLALILLPVLLAGCEAELNLAAVGEATRHASLRTDHYQALASNATVSVLVGNDGVILVSQDQGLNWQRQQLPGQPGLIDVDACPDGSFIALGFANQLWHSADQGLSWNAHTLPTQEQMLTATCAPDGAWWAAGSFTTLLNSQDQGANWDETSLDEDAMLTTLQFLDAQQAVVTGEFGLVFSSTDGGQSWQASGRLPEEFYPHASHFVSLDEGWVGGLNGFIYHTLDAGQNWQRQDTPSAAPIFNFSANRDGLFAIGDHSSVLRLSGERWQALPTPNAPAYLRAANSSDDHRLTVAGGRGLLLNLDTRPALAAQAQ